MGGEGGIGTMGGYKDYMGESRMGEKVFTNYGIFIQMKFRVLATEILIFKPVNDEITCWVSIKFFYIVVLSESYIKIIK